MLNACPRFCVKSPVRQWWGDIMWKKIKPNASFGIHAIWICYNHNEFPKSCIFNLPRLFNQGKYALRHSNLSLPVSCYKALIDHYTIQAGPNIYQGKVKLFSMQYVYYYMTNHQRSCMVFHQLCSHAAWRYWIHSMLMLSAVDEWDHHKVWVTWSSVAYNTLVYPIRCTGNPICQSMCAEIKGACCW